MYIYIYAILIFLSFLYEHLVPHQTADSLKNPTKPVQGEQVGRKGIRCSGVGTGQASVDTASSRGLLEERANQGQHYSTAMAKGFGDLITAALIFLGDYFHKIFTL